MKRHQKTTKYDTLPNKKTRYVYVIDDEEDEDEYLPMFSPTSSPPRFDPDSEGEVYSLSSPRYDDDQVSTSSSSSPYDPDSSNREEEDGPAFVPEKFFHTGKVPFHFEESRDGYCLNSGRTYTSITEELRRETNAEKALFCRNIQSFRSGQVVSKHIAPWGENAMLCGPDFIIEKKIFGANGQVVLVLIKSVSNDGSDLIVLMPAFFDGWMDTSAYFEYMACDEKLSNQ